MILKRQQKEIRELSLQANLQSERLQKIRGDVKNWKWEAFGRPESLLLAFLSGFAIVGRPTKVHSDNSDNTTVVEPPGKNRALQALEASFLAWRIIGRPVPSSLKEFSESEVS